MTNAERQARWRAAHPLARGDGEQVAELLDHPDGGPVTWLRRLTELGFEELSAVFVDQREFRIEVSFGDREHVEWSVSRRSTGGIRRKVMRSKGWDKLREFLNLTSKRLI